MSKSLCTTHHFSSVAHSAGLIAHLAGRMATGGDEAHKIETTVRDILRNVQDNSLEAVVAYTRQYDCPEFLPEMFAIQPEALREASGRIPDVDREIIRKAADRIRTFHAAQKEKNWFSTDEYGVMLGQVVTPLDRVGLYVPGGKGGETPLISSMLMNVIPAQVAGVREIAVVSPPGTDGTVNPYILAAAYELGIVEVYACGSAWGIAALAYGAGPLAPVDLVAGPGNIWVTTAKKLLLGKVGIDMLAGPSEICVIADETARPEWVAADMLSQAEHDPLASAVCITTDPAVAEAVLAELAVQVRSLPREDIATKSLEDWGAMVIVPDLATAAALANKLAPEHLELALADPWRVAGMVRHAGAVFLGNYAAESVGDYFAGPNHVLPTMGTARFSSGLSVATFCKKSNIIQISESFTREHAGSIARLARLEGLEGHARAVEVRLKHQE